MKGENEFAATYEDIAHFVFNMGIKRTHAVSVLVGALHDRQAVNFISSKPTVFLEYLCKHTYHDDDCDLDINNHSVDYEGENDNDNDDQYMNARNDNDSDHQYMNARNDNGSHDQYLNVRNDNDNDHQYMNARNDNASDDHQYMNARNDNDNDHQYMNARNDNGSDDQYSNIRNDNDNYDQYLNVRNDNDNYDQYMNARNDNDNDDQCVNKILDLVGSDDRFLQTWQNLFVTQRNIKDESSDVVSTVTSSRCNSIIVVKIHDAMRLKPSTWLNDTIIDAFALLISNQQNDSLYSRIRIIPCATLSTSMYGKFNPSKLKMCEKLVFLVNTNNSHWFSAVVNVKAEQVDCYDSLHKPSAVEKIDMKRHDHLKEVMHFCQKHELIGNTKKWKHTYMKCPQQPNSFDCGVHLCIQAQCLAFGWPVTYDIKRMNYFRVYILNCIVQNHLIDT